MTVRATPKTTSWDAIITSAPLNKDAAMALNGTHDDPVLTARQLRENLLPALARIEEELKTADPATKKELGQKKLAIQNQLKELNDKGKRPPGYASHFITVAREMLSRPMFQLIDKEAARRLEAQVVAEIARTGKLMESENV